ncbi:MAG TPA: hypothetical protein VF158_11545 [Longimicrobiales bacterium]
MKWANTARCGMLALALASTTGACRGRGAAAPDLSPMVDSLLPRLEVLSGLEAREPVRVAEQDRAAVRRYVEAQLDEELPPEELEGIRAAYAAFGLMPDTLDLRRLMLDLYTEQVVGYYDPDAETLYVVEGVPREEMWPVLVHELVHALQDQHVDLDSLIARERGNDRQTAAQAAIEGHATLVMFAWLMERRMGGAFDPRLLPDLAPQIEPLLEAQNEQFPVFRSAPRIIRQTLLFPYVNGARFVQALWGEDAGVGGGGYVAPLGDRLPQSTEQVLHPRDRFLGRRDAPTEVMLGPAPAGWRPLYSGTLGELETSILLSEHLGRGADSLAVGWDGDRYVLLVSPAGERALVWVSVWDSPAAADRFADAYRRVLAARAGRHGAVERLEVQGRPAVRVVDAPAAVAVEAVPDVGVVGVVEGADGG